MKNTISLTILLVLLSSIFAQQVDIFESGSSSEVEDDGGSNPSGQATGFALRARGESGGGGGGGRAAAVVETPNS